MAADNLTQNRTITPAMLPVASQITLASGVADVATMPDLATTPAPSVWRQMRKKLEGVFKKKSTIEPKVVCNLF